MRTIVFGIVSVLAAALCGRLGFWQLERLAERRALNQRVEARLAVAPVPELPQIASEDTEYRRVQVAGTYDTERPVVEVFRTRNGVPGVYVVYPLRMASGMAVLVERGWLPSPDARSVELAEYATADTVTVTGYVRPVESPDSLDTQSGSWPRYVRTADPARLGPLFPYEIAPVLVRRTGGEDPAGLDPLPLPALDEGSHFSYAVQWFSFGLIALIGGGIWIRRQRRPVRPG